jgi:hypothetical protein
MERPRTTGARGFAPSVAGRQHPGLQADTTDGSGSLTLTGTTG